jgi:hypothetical protein
MNADTPSDSPGSTGSAQGVATPLADEQVTAIATRPLVRRIFAACLLIELLLVVLDYVLNYADVLDQISVRRIWNVAREGSIPSWFSSTQAVAVGIAALAIGQVERLRGSELAPRAGWALVGLWFIYLGVDDAAEIHERMGGFLKSLIAEDPAERPALVRFLASLPSYSWQSFIAPFYGAVLILSVTFAAWFLGPHRLVRYLVGGFALFVISQGIDFIEGLETFEHVVFLDGLLGIEFFAGLEDADAFYQALADRLEVKLYLVEHTFKVVEELLEMLGTTLFLVGFLSYLSIRSAGLTLRLGAEPAAD